MNEQKAKRKATVEEVAEFLQVPPSWIYDRTRRNAIPFVKIGKYCRFDFDEIDTWIRSGGAAVGEEE